MKADFRYLFSPSSVAVVGATEDQGKLGFHVMKSLLSGGFSGRVIPVNPARQSVLGVKAYPSLKEVPGTVDLVVLVVPASKVLEQIGICANRGVRGIVLITAGFKEIDDPWGAQLEKQVGEAAKRASIPIIGPNTFGLVSLHEGLNASFTPEFSEVKPGGIALISQSGGMSHLLAFLALRYGARFSKIIGLGNRCNVDFQDLLEYLVMDPLTRCVALYIEGLERARELSQEAQRLKGQKPLVAYKCGRSELGNKASRSHTGSLAGSYEIYCGAFTQSGILWVESSESLLDAARVLEVCRPMIGNRVAILSGQAGPAMAALDVCLTNGLEVKPFDNQTSKKIERLLPPLALRVNPVDMGPAWYDKEAIREIVKAVMESEAVDAILLLIMFASANRGAVEGLRDLLMEFGQKKPVISCIAAPPNIWDEQVQELEGQEALVNYPTPERAATALANLWRWSRIIGNTGPAS